MPRSPSRIPQCGRRPRATSRVSSPEQGMVSSGRRQILSAELPMWRPAGRPGPPRSRSSESTWARDGCDSASLRDDDSTAAMPNPGLVHVIPMVPVFLSTLMIGLLLGVFAMLAGVERRSRGSSVSALAGPIVSRESLAAASNAISARFHIPVIATFATVFGAVGYPLSRYSGLRPGWQLLITSIAGGAAVAGTVVLIARWAVPSARRDVPDERYLLQGMFAQVMDPIERER